MYLKTIPSKQHSLMLVAFMTCILTCIFADTGAEANPFRMNKMNFIWAKAVHHISDANAIKRIKVEFEKFDRLYLSAKDQEEKYGKSDLAEIDSKLEKVLEKYGLEGAISAYNQKMKWRNEEEMKKSNDVLASDKFTDPKVDKLWRAALNAKFSESQLKALHKELKDHERRMREYDAKVSKFNEIPHENSLHEDSNTSDESRDELTRQLKNHYHDMESNYQELHRKILQSEKSPFRNDKVDQLWQLAMKNQNFTVTELESIRMDLHHFDKQMEKLRYHEEELKAAQRLHRGTDKTGVEIESLNEFQEKTERMKRKLKKFGNYLETKVSHTEL